MERQTLQIGLQLKQLTHMLDSGQQILQAYIAPVHDASAYHAIVLLVLVCSNAQVTRYSCTALTDLNASADTNEAIWQQPREHNHRLIV